MIRKGAEIQQPSPANGTKKSNGYSGDFYDDVINHDMEMDEWVTQHLEPTLAIWSIVYDYLVFFFGVEQYANGVS